MIHVYRHTIKGYAAVISEQRIRRIREDERVAYVEADALVSAVHHRPGHEIRRRYF